MFNIQLEKQQSMIGNKALEKVDEYTYLGQVAGTNQAHEKEIKRRIEMGWVAFGKCKLS